MSTPGIALPPGAKLVDPGELRLPPGAKLVSGPDQNQPGALERGVREFSANVGAPEQISDVPKGIAFAASHPIESAKLVGGSAIDAQRELNQRAYRELQTPGLASKGAGVLHWLESGVPFAGPALARAGDQFAAGNIAGGVGGTLGLAAPALLGKVTPTPPPTPIEGWQVAAPKTPPGVAPVASHEPLPRGNPIQRTVRAIVGTGEGPMKKTASKANIEHIQEVGETLQKNAEAQRAATEANATANQKALGDLQAQQDIIRQQNEAKIAETAAANQKAAAEHAAKVAEIEGKNKAAQEQIARRASLQQQVLDDSAALAQKIQQKAKAVRAEGSAKYDVVTRAVGDTGVTADQIADLVNHAQDKILAGSHPENVRQFKNILTLQGETGPVESSMGAIAPGTPLYEALVQRGVINAQEPVMVPFRDLGGYVTELGSRMYDAKNLGDVYSALKYVRDGIQNMRSDIAEAHGVGPQLAEANKFWANYENTYNNMRGMNYGGGSPVARLVRAVDPPTARQVLTGTASQRVVSMLAKEDPALGQLAEQIQKNHSESKTLPTRYTPQQPPAPPEPKTPNTKPVPQYYEAPDAKIAKQEPLPQPPNIPDAVEQARIKRIDDFVEKLRRPTVRSWEIAAAVTGLASEVVSSMMGGAGRGYAHLAAGSGVGMLGSMELMAQMLERPKVVEWLSKPTARDMAILNQMQAQPKVALRQAITQSMVKNHVPLSPEMKGFLLPAQAAAVAGAAAKNQQSNYTTPESVMLAMKNGELPVRDGNLLLQKMRGNRSSIVRPMEPPK